MFKKTLLATSALVVASSMALAAGNHHQLSHAQQVAKAKLAHQHVMAKHMPGVIFSPKNGTPIAAKFPLSSMKAGAHGQSAKFIPAGYSNFSKSKNALFISWFGWFAGKTNISYNSSYSYCLSYNSNYTVCYNHEHIHDIETIALQQSAAQPFTKVATASSVSVGAEQYSGSGGAKVTIYTDHSGAPGSAVAGAHGSFSSAPAFTGLCCSGLETVTFAPVTLGKKTQFWVVLSGNKGQTGRIAWNGQASNWTAYPTGEDYNYTATTKISDSYYTTRSGHTSHFSTTYSASSGGWIHTSSFTYEEQPGAFSVS